MRAFLLLTLLLAATLACIADDDSMGGHNQGSFGPPANCGGEGVPGGWSRIEGNVSEAVLEPVLEELWAAYGANLTALLGADTCPPEDLQTSAEGCSQVVAGTNYRLWINVTCATAGGNYSLGLVVDAFGPLPSAANTAVQIYDLDVEYIAKDGYQLNIDLDDGMHGDHFDGMFNATIGSITGDDDWMDDGSDSSDDSSGSTTSDALIEEGDDDMDDMPGSSGTDDGDNDDLGDNNGLNPNTNTVTGVVGSAAGRR